VKKTFQLLYLIAFSSLILPNPFAQIKYITRLHIQQTSLSIFVKTLVNEFKKADRYEVTFNSSGLASGVYIYRMNMKDFITSK